MRRASEFIAQAARGARAEFLSRAATEPCDWDLRAAIADAGVG